MVDTPQTTIEQKKSFLQCVRSAYLTHRQKREIARREAKEFHDFLKDFFQSRGVPKKFAKTDSNDIQPFGDTFALKTFQAIIKCIKPEDRPSVVRQLNNLATGQTGKETVGYVQERLSFDIFREVTHEPYTYPQYAQFVKVEDVIKRNFLDLICKGIQAYKRATPEARIKFNKAVTPRTKRAKVITQIIQQQR